MSDLAPEPHDAPAAPPHPSEAADGDGPPWIGDAIALARDEARRFVATALGFMRRPGRFSADWAAGRQGALNPLGFAATALGLSGAARALVPNGGGDTLVGSIALALLPYAYYAVIGVACHPLLRLFGSRRRLGASVAVALFAGGAPGLVVTLSTYAAIGLRDALFGRPEHALLRGIPVWAAAALGLLIYGPFLHYLVVLVRALAGLHAVGRARAVAAVVVSLAAVGVALGAMHSAVSFSVGVPHFVIWMYGGRPMPDIWF